MASINSNNNLSTTNSSAQVDASISNNLPSPSVISALLSCDAYCFDVDSTVITVEGIDVLAASLGLGEVIAEYTRQAMNGNIPFEQALIERLNLIKPSYLNVQQCLSNHPLQFTPHFQELVKLLKSLNKQIFLLSGGFRLMIEPVRIALDLPVDHVHANTLLFDGNGAYSGFDSNEFTCTTTGKARAIQHIIDESSDMKISISKVVMVGDGATDLAAKPPAHLFVGYGGIAVREKVKAGADWFITDWRELISVLQAPNNHIVQQEIAEGGITAEIVRNAENNN
jgi:phosphoserine phosphatase